MWNDTWVSDAREISTGDTETLLAGELLTVSTKCHRVSLRVLLVTVTVSFSNACSYFHFSFKFD